MTNFSMNILLFGISGGEILVIMMLVLLLFGPKKIPEIARMVGRGMNEFKKVQREINSEITRYSSEVETQARDMQAEIDNLVIKEPAKPLPAAGTENQTEQQEQPFPKRDNLEDPRQVNDDLPYPYNQIGKDS